MQSAIAAVTPLLPAGLPAPPSFRKQNPSEQPIIFLSLVSDTLPMSTIDEFAETQIAPRISMINGVSAGPGDGPAEVRRARPDRSG